MIITLSGMPGSGKSTVGKMLAKKLNYKFYSMGDLRGQLATERGLTIDELNKIGETEDWTDRPIDDYQKKLGQTENNFIIDSRAGFYFIPHAFKVFLDTDLMVAAKRIFDDPRPDENPFKDINEVYETLKLRIKSDDERFQKYYNLSYLDKNQYNIVIDTSKISPEEVTQEIINNLPKQ